MYLFKRKNGIYYLGFNQPDGTKAFKSTGTKYKSIAEKFKVQFEKSLYNEEKNPIEPIELMKFRRMFLIYSETTHSEKTTKAFKTTFRYLIEYFGEKKLLSNFTKKDVQEYLLHKQSQSSIFTARRDQINISSMFTYAQNFNYMQENVAKGIKRLRLPERMPLFYTKEDVDKLLSVIKNEDIYDIVVFALNTGMRSQEICSLTVRQVNISKKVAMLDNIGHITKSKRIRAVPLNDKALAVINRRMDRIIKEHLFTVNGNIVKSDKLSYFYKKNVRVAGLNDKLNFHSLRHTFASWLVQKGVSIYKVSKLLGHSSISTTQIYSHLQQEDLYDVVKLFDEF